MTLYAHRKVALGFCGRRGCYGKRFAKDENYGYICEAHFHGRK